MSKVLRTVKWVLICAAIGFLAARLQLGYDNQRAFDLVIQVVGILFLLWIVLRPSLPKWLRR